MKKLNKNNPATLPEWLDIATKDLAAPDNHRIQWEIEAHFAESVKAHLAQGKPEFEAQADALKELGKPKAAAKIFKRTVLTKSEARLLVDSQQWVKSRWSLFWPWLIGAAFLAVVFSLEGWDRFTITDHITNHRIAAVTFVAAWVAHLMIYSAIRLNWLRHRTTARHFIGFLGGPIFFFELGCLIKFSEISDLCFLWVIAWFISQSVAGIRCAFKIRSKARRALI